MKSPQVLAAALLLWIVTACGGSEPEPVARSADPSPTSAEETSSAPQPSPKRSAEPSDAVIPSDTPTQRDDDALVLIGTVGEPDDPEAFTISLTDGSGDAVERTKPGRYLLRITDPASYHNFHLTGPGVDKRTSVLGKSKVQWEVTLRPGRYTFVCDPHPQMVGNLLVTGDR